MKRNPLKKFIKFVFLSVALSCTEQVQISRQIDSNTILPNEARQAFQVEVSKTTIVLPNARTKFDRRVLSKDVNWDQAFYQDLSFGKALLVPVRYKTDIYYGIKETSTVLPLSSLTYLMFYKVLGNEVRMEMVTALPNYDTRDESASFKGLILVEEWGGNFITGYAFKNGGIFRVSAPSNSIGAEGRTDITCYSVPWYTCVSVGGVTIGCSLSGYDNVCTISDSGGGGGGGDPTGGGGGGGTSQDYGSIAANLNAQNKLCGSYVFAATGNGNTAQISGLGAKAYNPSKGQILHAYLGTVCVTFGSSSSVSNSGTGSAIFNQAWNSAMNMAQDWLNQQPGMPLSITFRNVIESKLRLNLDEFSDGYYQLTIGTCSGLPDNVASYCN